MDDFQCKFFLKNRLERNIDDYFIITDKIIGDGLSGNVYICYCKKKYKQYALKITKKTTNSYREIYIQSYLKCKNIINIIDLFLNEKKFYIILEYADRGDLFDNLKYKILNEDNILSIIYNISLIIRDIHLKKVIHGDLKLENVLIKNNKLCIADFGFSVFSNKNKLSKCFYTLPYTAPEQLDKNIFVYKSDIWSLGIIIYYFFYDKFPFEYDDNITNTYDTLQLFKKDLYFPENKKCSDEFKKLIINTLKYNIEERFDIYQVIYYIEKIFHKKDNFK
jgi:serine/threonine protein kinase